MLSVAHRAAIAAIEAEAMQRPETVYRRAQSLVVLGYAYVAGLILVPAILTLLCLYVTLVTASVVAAGFTAAFAVLAFGAMSALRVRAASVPGMLFSQRQLPELFARIEAVRARLDAPRPDRVILTQEFNASVQQVPHWGVLGTARRDLHVGLPVMLSLSPTQFDAVLAHEFSHYSGLHAKRGLRVRRAGVRWSVLRESLDGAGVWSAFLLRGFVHWIEPRLAAYGLVLGRLEEYGADADAARVTDVATQGSALVAFEVRAQAFTERVWSEIMRPAMMSEGVVTPAWQRMPELIRSADGEASRRSGVAVGLRRARREESSHPSLAERLRALGLLPDDPAQALEAACALHPPLEQDAATALLGARLPGILETLDDAWADEVRDAWSETFARAAAGRRRWESLQQAERDGAQLTADELAEGLVPTAILGDSLAARPLAERILALEPSHMDARAAVGAAMLAADDPAGLDLLARLAERYPHYLRSSLQHIEAFHAGRGEWSLAAAASASLVQLERDEFDQVEARHDVRATDEIMPVDLPESLIDAIRVAVMRDDRIESVLLAAKQPPGRPLERVLLIALCRTALSRHVAAADLELASEFLALIDEPIPPSLVMLDSPENAANHARIRRAGALEIRA